MEDSSFSDLIKRYHRKQAVCYKRPRYREARWERAVKVYTINNESKYLLVQGVPSVNVTNELLQLFESFGEVERMERLADYPCEEFTEAYHVKYKQIQSARFGKRKTDNRSFFGGQLHVCYAPEYESIQDTRRKLHERKKLVLRKCQESSVDESHTDSVQKKVMPKCDRTNVSNSSTSTRNSTIQYSDEPTITKDIQTSGRHSSFELFDVNRTFENTNRSTNKRPIIQESCLSNRRQTNTHDSPHFSSSENLQSSYPWIPTHHATLPPEIQQMQTKDVYQNMESNVISSRHSFMSPAPAPPSGSTASTTCEPVVKKKRIVWNNSSTCPVDVVSRPLDVGSFPLDVGTRTLDVGHTVGRQHEYTKEIGACDPYKQVASISDNHLLEQSQTQVRETSERNPRLKHTETKIKRNNSDGRKRI